jgi:hypothetical protein
VDRIRHTQQRAAWLAEHGAALGEALAEMAPDG